MNILQIKMTGLFYWARRMCKTNLFDTFAHWLSRWLLRHWNSKSKFCMRSTSKHRPEEIGTSYVSRFQNHKALSQPQLTLLIKSFTKASWIAVFGCRFFLSLTLNRFSSSHLGKSQSLHFAFLKRPKKDRKAFINVKMRIQKWKFCTGLLRNHHKSEDIGFIHVVTCGLSDLHWYEGIIAHVSYKYKSQVGITRDYPYRVSPPTFSVNVEMGLLKSLSTVPP